MFELLCMCWKVLEKWFISYPDYYQASMQLNWKELQNSTETRDFKLSLYNHMVTMSFYKKCEGNSVDEETLHVQYVNGVRDEMFCLASSYAYQHSLLHIANSSNVQNPPDYFKKIHMWTGVVGQELVVVSVYSEQDKKWCGVPQDYTKTLRN